MKAIIAQDPSSQREHVLRLAAHTAHKAGALASRTQYLLTARTVLVYVWGPSSAPGKVGGIEPVQWTRSAKWVAMTFLVGG
jgi:hypothetical protein